MELFCRFYHMCIMQLNKLLNSRTVGFAARSPFCRQKVTASPLCGYLGYRGFSTSDQSFQSNKIYELRRYVIKLDCLAAYRKLCQDLFHLRTEHSVLNGFWFSEMGSNISQSVHIWEYDSLSHRAKVRAALNSAEEWQTQFVPKVVQMLQNQTNTSMVMPSWCPPFKTSPKKNGVYELMTYKMVMGGPAVWDHKLKASIEAHVRLGYSELIGVWYTDLGDHNTVQVLWRYDTYEMRDDGREKAHRDAVVVNKVRDNLNNVTSHSSELLLPATWSPVQ